MTATGPTSPPPATVDVDGNADSDRHTDTGATNEADRQTDPDRRTDSGATNDPDRQTDPDDNPSGGRARELRRAALAVLSERGLAGTTAAAIEAKAGADAGQVERAWGSLGALVEAASNEAVRDRLDTYRRALAAAQTLPELLAVGMAIHEHERREGAMTVMAQVTAGAPYDPALARAADYGLSLWTAQIREVLERVLADTPAGDLLDPDGLARVITASFIGIELAHGPDPRGAERTFAAIGQVNALIAAINDLGPVTRLALKLSARRVRRRVAEQQHATQSLLALEGLTRQGV